MPDHNGKPSDGQKSPRDDLIAVGDPALRLVVRLIQKKDFRQLEQRTGIRIPVEKRHGFWCRVAVRLREFFRRFFGKTEATKPGPTLPVLIQLDAAKGVRRFPDEFYKRYGIPLAYRAALERNAQLKHLTARLPLHGDIFKGSVNSLVNAVSELRAAGIGRVCLGAPGQPSQANQPSLDWAELVDVQLNSSYEGNALTGNGVVVGIIDDGCALAHCDFLKPRAANSPAESRIRYLWDQGGADNPPLPWKSVTDFYGRELDKKAIDDALNLPANRNGHLIREDAVYEQLDYRIREVATHGTHVMDIAAGTGQSLMGVQGVAPGAEIIFVQLPIHAIDEGAAALWPYIVDGVRYIFDRAAKLDGGNKPAVVNISYGGYDGPHDGTSELEQALDEMLAEPERAIVLAAGNGFEARCHATKAVQKNAPAPASLHWIVNAQDQTANELDLWYDHNSELRIRLTPPRGAINPAGWIALGQASDITRSDGRIIGYIEHLSSGMGNNANRVFVSLNPTDAAADAGAHARAPSGVWTVELEHHKGPNAQVHAWIWRDDAGRARNAQLRQSRFRPDDASPDYTIGGWATGHVAISVGAYNAATEEVCRYSACGPTRPVGGKPDRAKPDIYAPAEEDVRGRGVLSASALSARPTRMNGTSASAPQVTGLIALLFEYARANGLNLPNDEIIQYLEAGAVPADTLRFNRHQKVDDRVAIKQGHVKVDLLSSREAVRPGH